MTISIVFLALLFFKLFFKITAGNHSGAVADARASHQERRGVHNIQTLGINSSSNNATVTL